jgi:hypothetical protein
MAPPRRSVETCQRAVDLLALHGDKVAASRAMGLSRSAFQSVIWDAKDRGIKPTVSAPQPEAPQIDIAGGIRAILTKRSASLSDLMTASGASPDAVLAAIDRLTADGYKVIRSDNTWQIPKQTQAAYVGGAKIQLISRPDNTYLFGACGDQHIGSKYFREDVLTGVYDRYERAGVQCVFNTGNWIDGEANFNRYDIVAHGMDEQLRLMASVFPKKDFPTYAVTGDDHEGWYAQREGIDVGKYAENVMRSEGHDWHDLGYMEAHVELVNANTGAKAVLAVVHPGGGSAYATSYKPQKIIESYEGGEKPAIALYGHYHKMESGLTRNVWYLQTGCTQDQTPFMRKKSLEAHVGGAMIGLEQDPDTGAITGFTPTLWRYFKRHYYESPQTNGWSKHGAVSAQPRSVGGI